MECKYQKKRKRERKKRKELQSSIKKTIACEDWAQYESKARRLSNICSCNAAELKNGTHLECMVDYKTVHESDKNLISRTRIWEWEREKCIDTHNLEYTYIIVCIRHSSRWHRAWQSSKFTHGANEFLAFLIFTRLLSCNPLLNVAKTQYEKQMQVEREKKHTHTVIIVFRCSWTFLPLFYSLLFTEYFRLKIKLTESHVHFHDAFNFVPGTTWEYTDVYESLLYTRCILFSFTFHCFCSLSLLYIPFFFGILLFWSLIKYIQRFFFAHKEKAHYFKFLLLVFYA